MRATSPDQRVSCVCAGIQLDIGAVWPSDWLHHVSAIDRGMLCAASIEANINLTLTVSERVVGMTVAPTQECWWEYDDSRPMGCFMRACYLYQHVIMPSDEAQASRVEVQRYCQLRCAEGAHHGKTRRIPRPSSLVRYTVLQHPVRNLALASPGVPPASIICLRRIRSCRHPPTVLLPFASSSSSSSFPRRIASRLSCISVYVLPSSAAATPAAAPL